VSNGIGNNEYDTKLAAARVRETFGVNPSSGPTPVGVNPNLVGVILNESSVGRPVSLGDLREVRVVVVPHANQRYDTVGDWFFEEGTLVIKVSSLRDPRATWAVAVHEFIEAILCTNAGITPQMVDAWDLGEGADSNDPGMNWSAPYHKQHLHATSVERRLAETMGLVWEAHNRIVDNPEGRKE
jgi:hypothetical protein